jgi:inner membrane protein
MDPVTHIASGGLGGRALRDYFPGRSFTFYVIAAAMIPDIDNFVGIGNPELYLIHHRGITHSFLGGLVVACLLAGLFRLFTRSIPFWKGAVIAYAAVSIHIFLDLITSYGTQIFAPLTDERYTLRCVFIIDPLFTLTLIGFWTAAAIWQRKGRSIAIAGLCCLVIYPGISLGVRKVLESHLNGRLRAEGVRFERLELSPEILTPFVWKVVVEDESHYRMGSVDIFSLRRPIHLESFLKADQSLLQELGRNVSFFRTFNWFAVYPIMRIQKSGDGSRVTFGDLRFYSTLIRRSTGDGGDFFSLTAILDRNRRITSYEFGHSGTRRLIERVE